MEQTPLEFHINEIEMPSEPSKDACREPARSNHAAWYAKGSITRYREWPCGCSTHYRGGLDMEILMCRKCRAVARGFPSWQQLSYSVDCHILQISLSVISTQRLLNVQWNCSGVPMSLHIRWHHETPHRVMSPPRGVGLLESWSSDV